MSVTDEALNGLTLVTSATGFDFLGALPADGIARRFTGATLNRAISAVIVIDTAAQLEALATSNVITITSRTTFVFQAEITSTVQFVIESTGALELQTKGILGSYIWGGTGTLFSGEGSVFIRQSFHITSTSTGTMFDISLGFLGSVQLQPATFTGFDDIGTIEGGTVLIDTPFFNGWDVGLTFNNVINISSRMLVCANGSSTNTFITITDDKTISALIEPIYRFTNSTFSLNGTSCAMRIDPDINEDVRLSIVNGKVTGGGGLYNTAGSTGTFTAVADATVSATAITSVTDSGGVARFNFSVGPTVYVDQEVVVSTFSTNTAYNGTYKITATGAGYFEIADIAFGSDETGSFLSNSVTLTDTTTTLADGNTLYLDTTSATDYDGGATVYNKQTNSVQVNRTYTVTKTGTWNTGGVTQTDPRIVAVEQRELPDSHYIIAAHVNNNTTANGAIVNNTFTDMVFGTAGSALVADTTMERWKLIDDVNGTFEYIGTEPYDGSLSFDFTVVSSGGAQEFRFAWQIDTGSGFGDLPDHIEGLAEVGSTATSISKSFPLRANLGDKIKPEITRNSGSSGITCSYATIFGMQ